MNPRPFAATFAAAAVAALAVTSLSSPAQAAEDVYTPPATISGSPGSILKQAPGTYALDALGGKADATVTKVQYVSTGAKGNRTAVTGTVIVPKAPGRRAASVRSSR